VLKDGHTLELNGEVAGTIFDERLAKRLVEALNRFAVIDGLLLRRNIDIMDCNLQEVLCRSSS
jgi:hypothetical protein